MTDPRPGFQRDSNAVVDAFKAGLAFDPPVISPTEFREALRMVGYPLSTDDSLDPPQFDFPVPSDLVVEISTPEEDI